VVLTALALVAAAVALTTQMRAQWQLMVLWGVLVGSGTGVTSLVLAAIVATRWFEARRGLVIGALSAANATGQLIFLPLLARLVERDGWRAACALVAAAAVVVFALVLALMRDRPQDVGLRRYGEGSGEAATPPPSALAPQMKKVANKIQNTRVFAPSRNAPSAAAVIGAVLGGGAGSGSVQRAVGHQLDA